MMEEPELPSTVATPKGKQTKQRLVAVLGFSMVGKTALCQRFANNRFNERYRPTYENTFRRSLRHHGEAIELVITDTQGDHGESMFRSEYGLGYHGYMLVYSITSRRSLDTIKAINLKLLSLTGNQTVPRILVGTKLDLAHEDLRQVPTALGQSLAAEMHCPFVETTAKLGDNVDRAFQLVLNEIEKAYEPERERRCVDCNDYNMFACCERSGSEDRRLDEGSLLERSVGFLLALTVLFGFGTFLLGCLLAASSEAGHNALAYSAFVFGLLLLVLASVGLWATRTGSRETLRLYAIGIVVLVVAEVIVVGAICQRKIFKHHREAAICVVSSLLFVETLSALLVGWYQGFLEPSTERLDVAYSEPTHAVLTAAEPYYTLYEPV